jgi:hypothetical protein
MSAKIVVGPIDRGLKTNRTAFVIDNDSFPTLINAYQWRGRVKRKRGTDLLVRLQRFFNSTSTAYNPGLNTIVLVAGAGNLLTTFSVSVPQFTLQSNGNIVPGSIRITDGGNVYTDPTPPDGTLLKNGVADPGSTINYATGAFQLAGVGNDTVTTQFLYNPNLPVMGLRDFVIEYQPFPSTIAFDTVYAYNIVTTTPHVAYDVSFYKDPALDATNLPGYIRKVVPTPTTWNGKDYQQFWTVNYQGALWATNGINVPFTTTNVGMQYAPKASITFVGRTATTITVTIANSPLVVGDFVFFNEWTSLAAVTPPNSGFLNFQSGYVTSIVGPNITITLPFANLPADTYIPGIIQYLTNRSDVTKDSLRWYDGDPTDGNATNPTLSGFNGWVNFAPPLSQAPAPIAGLPAAIYYLVGARIIFPFKDRLLFIGPVVQTSAAGSQEYLQDTIIYSQNGTPYYTTSFTPNTSGFVTDPTITFHPILVPEDQTATPSAYFDDSTGFGGNVTAGIDYPIITCASNEDVLILGFSVLQMKFVYTGDDIIPFLFYQINSEYGSASTFSVINMGEGVLTKGSRGYIMTSQVDAQRIDLDIPDQVFEVNLTNNGNERFTAIRDFINEWIYLSYPGNQEGSAENTRFNSQTLQYNYRDNSWAVFNECYTTYGNFREVTGNTWSNIGASLPQPMWSAWNSAWNSGSSTLLQPAIIAGTPQGFVMLRAMETVTATDEGNSITIQSFSGNLVTSPNHGLENGDYILIDGALGTIGTQVNNKIFSVYAVTLNSFRLDPSISSGTYSGLALITRMYVPKIQTKQFPTAWGIGRKTRLGVQQYLFTATSTSQVTLQIFLSQNQADPYNAGQIVPSTIPSPPVNNSLIYSQVLYTCPESTNLGLTPANTNLNMVTASSQQQIWHRVNTSLIGDTVQIGITLSDAQMRDPNFNFQFDEIELHGIIMDVSPSMMLS